MSIILQICFFLFWIAVGITLLIYCFFWYENAGTIRRRTLEASGISLRRLTADGIVTGIASIILVVIFYPLGFIPQLWRPRRIAPSQPILIMVHGLYHSASAWAVMQKHLKKAGFNNIFAVSYRSWFTSFEATLTKFEEFVRNSRSAALNQPFIIIGHSLGGLIARVYAERSEGENVPAAVITLGTPHKGSKMVAFATGKLARSLEYEGDLFRMIEREAPPFPSTGIALFSPADGLVLPAESLQSPPSNWSRYETQPMSHVWMLYSKSVALKVIEFLKNGGLLTGGQ